MWRRSRCRRLPLLISKVLYGVEEQIDSETPSEYENKNFKMETNNRIEIDNRIFAFTNKELEQFITEPIKEYLQGLVPMNFGNKKITSALNEDDFKCDMKTLKNDLIKYKSELKECLDFGIKGAGSNYLYADADPYDNYYYGSKYMDAIKYLYNTISLHPLEFVKAAREETYNVGIEDIPSEVDLEPVVKEINKETNKFYFVYPPGFYRMVEKCCLKEFNPYKGKDPLTIHSDDWILQSRTQQFLSNPGFAPYNTDLSAKKGYEYNGLKYAYITCLFDVQRKIDIHTGIDFGSWQKSVPIKSFIRGTVLECTWNKSKNDKAGKGYGNMMLIEGENGFLYLLAHLKTYLKQKGDSIFPGDDVAMSGQTGNSTGYHLHLEMIKPIIKTKKIYVINKSDNQFIGWFSPDQLNNRYNPFNHKDIFGSFRGEN